MMKKVLTYISGRATCMSAFLAAALALTAVSCAEDETVGPVSNGNGVEGETTRFVAGLPATRTTMDVDGNFQWVVDDNIWVDMGDELLASTGSDITDATAPQDRAEFTFEGRFTYPSYDVYYTGTNSTKGDEVTIAAEQRQAKPNDAAHFGLCGDCGVATATRQDDGSYAFNLDHKASYIVIEPKLKDAPTGDYCKVKKVVIREKNGKNICGTYPLTADGGLQVDKVQNGSSTITVTCGVDIEAVPEDEPVSILVDGKDGYPNGFNVYQEARPLENRIYVVIAPGTYDLEVECTVAYYAYQNSHHTPNPDYDEYRPEENAKYKGWKFETVENRQMATTTYQETFQVNHYKRLQPVLPLTDPTAAIDKRYQFDAYYMWGAKKWFWDGVAEYPKCNDGAQATDQPDPSTSPDRWHDIAYKPNQRVISYVDVERYNYSSKMYPESSATSWTNRDIHDQAHNVGGDAWKNAITANQMTYYVVYGDPYLDVDTQWILENYNGFSTICTGGVWLKKKAAIVRDAGVTWPDNLDYNMWNVNQQSAPLPYPTYASYSNGTYNKDVYGTYSWDIENYTANRRYNLRYIAPGYNFRMPVKHGQPSVDGKNMDDYFFLPCLGRIEYQNPDTPDIPTLTLVGGQGFYWSRTPVQFNIGNTQFYYTGPGGYDNAFYFNIHYNYIAVSWQQRYDYMKTGMRIATTDVFK